MDSKTEELLWMLLWTCDCLSRPTFRNLTESFEGWAYRNGFLRQLQRLEKQQWLEHRPADRLHRLSEAGQVQALGGIDPVARWNRRWDGRWRLVLFDVPENRGAIRNRLRQHLKSRGFGYLQKSVWVTPDPAKNEREILADGPVDVGSLLLLEARPCAGETDADIVTGAWDFDEINRRYAAHRDVLEQRPLGNLGHVAAATAFRDWLREERAAWSHAMACDPLLPGVLLPEGYTGRDAWRHRMDVMAEAGAQMRSFQGA